MSYLNERVILVTGASGQVGFELVRSFQGLGRVVAPGRDTLDLASGRQIEELIRNVRPSLIVNPAAYTAVDHAETEIDLANSINAVAPGILASEARRLRIPLIHYSTDYVFDGTGDGAYSEGDRVGPLNVYGKSKLDGELAIAEAGASHLVLRTSWVYGAHGRNFVQTMLRLAAQRTELRVVDDQVGAPTWARTIAELTAHIVAQAFAVQEKDRQEWWAQRSGIYHLTASGYTSWAGFAEAIFDIAAMPVRPRIVPITSDEYPTPAQRPRNSRLSGAKLSATFGLRPPDWRDALHLCLAEREA